MTEAYLAAVDPKLDLVLERTVDVPVDLVWAAWTEPERLKQWFTPKPWQTVDCEIDLRPGGIFKTVMRSPEGQEFPSAGDPSVETLVRDTLGGLSGLAEKTMFGGRVWLLDGHLLCGTRHDGMLARLGKGQDGWALDLPGVVPMFSGARRMHGWVRGNPDACRDEALRRRLLDAALAFVQALPPKKERT